MPEGVYETGLAIILVMFSLSAYACKCPVIHIKHEADKAYDVVIGKVISEREEILSCNNEVLDCSFIVEVEFSFKGKLRGTTKIFGGKGRGGCGGVLYKGFEYLLVVKHCEDGLYTTMCSDNSFLSDAYAQIQFLNEHFNTEYKNYRIGFLTEILFAVAVIMSGAALITFKFYRRRLSLTGSADDQIVPFIKRFHNRNSRFDERHHPYI